MLVKTPSPRFGWLKWITIVVVLVVMACLVYLGYLYYAIQKDKTNGFDKSETIAREHTRLSTVNGISRFQAEKTYDIVSGKTKQNKHVYIFVQKGKDKAVTTVNAQKTISKQDVKDQWESQCDNCEFVRIKPAMIDKKPLWEVAYWDDRDHYILDYISMYDGKQSQQFRLKSMFDKGR